jgi:hypothetical protein
VAVKCQEEYKLEQFELEDIIERYAEFICARNENTTYSELDNFMEGEKIFYLIIYTQQLEKNISRI